MKVALGATQNLLWYFLLLPVSLGGVSLNPLILVLFASRLFSRKKLRHLSVSLPLASTSLILVYGILFISGGDGSIIAAQIFNFFYLASLILILGLNLKLDLDTLCLVVVSTCALYSVWVFFALQISGLAITSPYAIKGDLRDYVPHWPQRFSTLFAFAIIVCLPRVKRDLRWGWVLIPLVIVDFLTFTRSAWLALIIGLIAYWIASSFRKQSFKMLMSKRNFIFTVAIFGGLFYFVVSNQPLVLSVIEVFIKISDRLIFSILNGGTTEGSDILRVSYWTEALDLWKASPIFGTGFAGVSAFHPHIGSYHSQYVDYLSRTGIVGLTVYASYWIFALVHYARQAPEVFGGLVSILIFGFFNETTKLSYTGILLFMLVNLALANRLQRRAA